MPRGLQVAHTWANVRDGGSFQRQASSDGQHSVSGAVLVDGDKAETAIEEILGYTYVAGGRLRRRLPQTHPLKDWLVATRAGPTQNLGFRGPNTVVDGRPPTYEKATIPITFESLTYNLLDDEQIIEPRDEIKRFVSVNKRSDAQLLSLPGSSLKYADSRANSRNGSAISGSPGVIVSSLDVQMCWHQIPEAAVPYSTIDATVGKVNNAAFDLQLIGLNMAAETVLLLPPDTSKRYRMANGAWAVDVMYTFKVRRSGHNAFFDHLAGSPAGSAAGYYRASRSGTVHALGQGTAGDMLYDAADFSQLFVVNAG